MAQWKRIIETTYAECHRTGWLGAWDAIKAAITGDERLVVVKPLTVSAWVRADCEVKFDIAGVSLEVRY